VVPAEDPSRSAEDLLDAFYDILSADTGEN
jgi:hypothetical protein